MSSTRTLNLFELNANIKELKARVDAGQLTEGQIKDTLDSLELPRNQKLDNLANWIDSNEGRIDLLKEKMQEIKLAIRGMENQNKALNRYITQAIDDMGYKSLRTGHHIFKTRSYKATTVIENTGEIPDEYIKVIQREPERRPDRNAIYKALKGGKQVPGAHLKPNRKTTIL